MKKTTAQWNKTIELYASCPYCEWTNDIAHEHDIYHDYDDEFSKKELEDDEFECDNCGKIFGLTRIYKE